MPCNVSGFTLHHGSILTGLALAISLCVSTPAVSARVGPPLLCHPLEIGDARSVPFGDDAFETLCSVSPKEAAGQSLEILAASESVLVHMETVRRAVIYLAWGDAKGDADAVVALDAWLAVLAERESSARLAVQAQGLSAEALGAAQRAHALACLHLVYAHEALAETGDDRMSRRASLELLETATSVLDDSGAVALAGALIHLAFGDDSRSLPLLAKALACGQDDAQLEHNVCVTMGVFLGETDPDRLNALVSAKLKRI